MNLHLPNVRRVFLRTYIRHSRHITDTRTMTLQLLLSNMPVLPLCMKGSYSGSWRPSEAMLAALLKKSWLSPMAFQNLLSYLLWKISLIGIYQSLPPRYQMGFIRQPRVRFLTRLDFLLTIEVLKASPLTNSPTSHKHRCLLSFHRHGWVGKSLCLQPLFNLFLQPEAPSLPPLPNIFPTLLYPPNLLALVLLVLPSPPNGSLFQNHL